MQHQIMIFRRCFTVRFRLSGLNSSPGNLLTYMYVWAYIYSFKQDLLLEALLLSWQHSCTSPTTHAGVQASLRLVKDMQPCVGLPGLVKPKVFKKVFRYLGFLGF